MNGQWGDYRGLTQMQRLRLLYGYNLRQETRKMWSIKIENGTCFIDGDGELHLHFGETQAVRNTGADKPKATPRPWRPKEFFPKDSGPFFGEIKSGQDEVD